MLKYMLTTKCNRKCSYCITKNVVSKESNNLKKLQRILWDLRYKGITEIMLTGGEPTQSKLFYTKVLIAGLIFGRVYITTQNKELLQKAKGLNEGILQFVKGITFSLHGEEPIEVKTDIPVYAAIMDYQYKEDLPSKLKKLGYSGLTINEDQRGNMTFSKQVREIPNFSIRINRQGKCLRETIILPDLRVIDSFIPFL